MAVQEVKLYEHRNVSQLADSVTEESPEVIITTHLTNAVAQLTSLGIAGETTLEALIFQITEFDNVLVYCQQLQLQLDDIKSVQPGDLHACFQLSANGLRKLQALTSLINQLPGDLWGYRDGCFASYDMDFRLAALQQKQAVLLPLKSKLAPFVDTNLIFESVALIQIQDVIQHAGLLRWFSGRWRNAKKMALSLSVNKHLKLADIALLFPAMITYSKAKQEFNTLFAQEAILSDLNQGVESNLKTIERVREWYKNVQFQIEEDFCGDAVIAQGLFNLNAQSAVELLQHNLAIVDAIQQLNRKMTKLKLAYPGYTGLRNADLEFADAIMQLKANIFEPLGVLCAHVQDKGQRLDSCIVARTCQ